MSDQLGLFGGDGIEPIITDEDRELAARIPSFIRFGTSSWSFPGWSGILWRGTHTEADLAKRGLVAYAQHPLFRTVGFDRTYYRPLRDADIAEYRAQLDAARERAPNLVPFRAVSKVWDEITTAVFPSHPRYGPRAGQKNPAFLDAEVFKSEVLAPYARVGATGPFVFELTPMPRGTFEPDALYTRIAAFLEALPTGNRYAFELRNPEYFGPRWMDLLRAHGASHVYNLWTAMPSLRVQLRTDKPTARFVVLRLMQPAFTKYEDRKKALAPFTELKDPQPEMRDDVVELLLAAAEIGASEAFVVANNKAEGSSPLTVRALAQMTVRAFGR